MQRNAHKLHPCRKVASCVCVCVCLLPLYAQWRAGINRVCLKTATDRRHGFPKPIRAICVATLFHTFTTPHGMRMLSRFSRPTASFAQEFHVALCQTTERGWWKTSCEMDCIHIPPAGGSCESELALLLPPFYPPPFGL